MIHGEIALEAVDVSKRFGSVAALTDVSFAAHYGEVTCLLGDNGAGKSTLIKLLSGVYRPDRGELRLDGAPTRFESPRDALDAGIAPVFQDLAMIPLMPVTRNFFLGREPKLRFGPIQRVDWRRAREVTVTELRRVGIHLRDPNQAVGTLSGGERQSVAISRAVYFGARVLILDEPTSALGVREASIVLRLIDDARRRGLAVIFVTHNVAHAHAIGDRFLVLNRGREAGRYLRGDVSRIELQDLMAGGQEMDELALNLGFAAGPATE